LTARRHLSRASVVMDRNRTMSVRHKNGAFYDGTTARNSYAKTTTRRIRTDEGCSRCEERERQNYRTRETRYLSLN